VPQWLKIWLCTDLRGRSPRSQDLPISTRMVRNSSSPGSLLNASSNPGTLHPNGLQIVRSGEIWHAENKPHTVVSILKHKNQSPLVSQVSLRKVEVNVRNLRYLLLLVGPLVLIEACSNPPSGPVGGDSARADLIPSSVGSSWTYEWEDRRSGETDTVVVRVAAMLDSSVVGPVGVWIIEYPRKPDSMFMEIVGDTVRFLTDLRRPSWNTKYVLPLYVGAGWRGDFVTDSSWVSGKGEIMVPAGEFSDAFQIEESWGAFNSYGRVTTWIVAGIGIVMEDRVEIDLGWGPSYVRRLLSFDISESQV